jgi:hypothetical protein
VSDPLKGSPKPDRGSIEPFGLSQAQGSAISSAKAVPDGKMLMFEGVGCLSGRAEGGRKVLLTMFARQIFPSRRQSKGPVNHSYNSVASVRERVCAGSVWYRVEGFS